MEQEPAPLVSPGDHPAVAVDVVRVPTRARVVLVGGERRSRSPALGFVAACLVVLVVAAVMP